MEIPPPAPVGSQAGPFAPDTPAPAVVRLFGDTGAVWFLSSASAAVWQLRPGVAPHVSSFTTLYDRAETWLAATGAGFVKLEWAGRTFEKLRVLKATQEDPHHVTVHVADSRYDWRYLRFFGRANLRRKVNDITLNTLQTAFGDESIGTRLGVDALRDDMSGFSEERYRSWTVKDDGSPRTAKEMLIVVLSALHIELGRPTQFDPAAAQRMPDNGDVIEQSEYLGELYVTILENLLKRSELALTLDPDASVRIYDPYLPLVMPAARVKGGALRIPDMSRIRPKVIEVYALPERDRRGVFRAGGDQGKDNPNTNKAKDAPALSGTFKLQNVLPLPLIDEIGGVTREAGEYVLITDALTAWGISEADVQNLWMFGGDGLKKKYARRIINATEIFDPIVMRRIHAILQNYRQTWRIEPKYLDTLRGWKPATAAIVSRRTHARQNSPVYMEWFDMFPAMPIDQRRGPFSKTGDNLSSWEQMGPTGAPIALDPPQTAPAVLKVVDEQLGIFRTELLEAVDGGVAERIPSHLTKIPEIFNTGVRQRQQFFFKDTHLRASFRLEVIISVIEGTPNFSDTDPLGGKAAFFVERFENQIGEGGADVEKLQLVLRQDTARFDEHGKLVNGAQLKALARSEALAAAWSYEDRPIGVLTLAHDPAAAWRLNGHMLGIQFVKAQNGAEAVIVNCGEPPPERSPVRAWPQAVRDFIYKALPNQE